MINAENTKFTIECQKKFGIYNIVNKKYDMKNLYEIIKSYIYNFNYTNNVKKIKEEKMFDLQEMGYNFKYRGTLYILDAIEYIYKSNNMDLLENLEKNVYNIIANKYNKSINNIKTNIIKSTNSIQNNNNDYKENTPKAIITKILIKLCNKD